MLFAFKIVSVCVHRIIINFFQINASIQAFVKVRAIGTLHELHESLATLEGKNTFAEYNIGPLTKQPLIYDMFKFPTDKPDSEIPHITTIDILEVLRQYLTQKNLWRARVKLEDFMEHVVQFYNVESPYLLGIRFQSVGLGISVSCFYSCCVSSVCVLFLFLPGKLLKITTLIKEY